MSEDVLLHFSSNSNGSDPSLPTKLAKLEARMAGKGSSSAPAWQQSSSAVTPAKSGGDEIFEEPSFSSDSDDDDTGDEFLIRPTVQKRQRLQEDDQATAVQQSEGLLEGRLKSAEISDAKIGPDDVNRKRQSRGRGRSSTVRGRGSRGNDQSRSHVSSSAISSSNDLIENSQHKESCSKDQFRMNEKASLLEEISSLCGKATSLEEDLNKARKESADHQQLCRQLEKELRDIKEREQQIKSKRLKVLSDLLISVSKAERQEARMKVRQDSLRLGNVGVIRAGTIISETWEDGQTLKDLNAHLIHSNRRNRLEHKQLNDLVYVCYNQILHHRYQKRDSIDPISLKDIDDSNEWLTGQMDSLDLDEGGDGTGASDLVFPGEDLDWAIVSEAAGVDEPQARTRAKGKAPASRSNVYQRRGRARLAQVDEEEDVDEEEEEEFVCDDDSDDYPEDETYDIDSE